MASGFVVVLILCLVLFFAIRRKQAQVAREQYQGIIRKKSSAAKTGYSRGTTVHPENNGRMDALYNAFSLSLSVNIIIFEDILTHRLLNVQKNGKLFKKFLLKIQEKEWSVWSVKYVTVIITQITIEDAQNSTLTSGAYRRCRFGLVVVLS